MLTEVKFFLQKEIRRSCFAHGKVMKTKQNNKKKNNNNNNSNRKMTKINVCKSHLKNDQEFYLGIDDREIFKEVFN